MRFLPVPAHRLASLSAITLMLLAGCGGVAAPGATSSPAAGATQPAVTAVAQAVASPTVAPTPPPTPTTVPTPAPTAIPTVAPSPTPAMGARWPANVKPNELGDIMVLEYHVIGDEEERWTRTRENFRKDLEYLYKNGYYLINMRDMVENRIDVPAGKSPVVLTFDDSSRGQFQFIKNPDGSLKVDPRSGLGILEAFINAHPDFGRAAVFCILPGADPPNDLFGQPEHSKEKLQYLAKQGYEICNHTLWHANLSTIDREETVRQLAEATRIVREAVPGYEIVTFNPPHGVYPKDLSPVLEGTYKGVSYRHRAILEVSGGATGAPNHRTTDLLHTWRIQATPSELDNWFTHFEKNPDQRYVSDGDPDRLVFPENWRKDYRAPEGAKEIASPEPNYVVVQLRERGR